MRRTLLVAATTVGVLAASVGAALAATAAAADADGDPFEVLVYSRTEGFRHASIPVGIATIEALGDDHGFDVEATEDPAAFTDEHLARFAAVVFLNTTGDVLDDPGREAFERYVRGGGAWVGVHSAADTEYDWAFYEELLGGAYFHSHPIQQPGVLVVDDANHPSTAHLPERWLVPFEEFYSFTRNPRDRVRVLLTIDESTYLQDPNTTHLPDGPAFPEGESGVMGDDHPMSWCHDVDAGRAWYTALGHEIHVYALPEFREHLLGGILTAAGRLDADCRVVPAGGATDTAGETTRTDGRDDGEADVRSEADGREDRQEADTGAGPGSGSTAAPEQQGTLPVTGSRANTGPALLLLGLVAALARRWTQQARTS
jgi:uncharacterized protein